MKSNTIWALVAGLAVGFIIGREYTRAQGDGGGGGPVKTAAKDDGNTTIPDSWLKEADVNAVEQFVGLTAKQRYNVLKVLNEKPCDCGCPHGSYAKCKKDDPNCPRAPVVIRDAIAAAKAGKSYDEIVDAVKKPGGGGNGQAAGPPPEQPQKVQLAAWTPIKGPKNAKVTIVEYSDFQCPFCSRVVPTVKEVEQKYGKDVRIAFRHQPLPFHNRAKEAAEAAMAANAQGKFWEMHDKLFANQQKLERADLDGYAKEIGLNMTKYAAAMDQHAYAKQVESDSQYGTSVGASGTPHFFINGRPLSGAQPFDSFKKVIDEEIAHADKLLKSGTAADKLYEALLNDLPKVAAAPAAPAEPTGPVKIDVGDAPVKGPKNAPVTLVIFSDFQCPFCSRAVPTMKQIEDDYKGKVRMAFKQKPLPFHDKAGLAAEAALAANEQGKFWEMHDKLFANQQQLERPALEKYAEELKLDMGKFKSALDSHKFAERVKKETALGDSVGAGGTPTFFVNGRKLVGAQPVDQFKKLIDEELAKK